MRNVHGKTATSFNMYSLRICMIELIANREKKNLLDQILWNIMIYEKVQTKYHAIAIYIYRPIYILTPDFMDDVTCTP